MGAIHRLSQKQIDAAGDGWLCDGGCLYLRRKGVAASWVFRYTWRGDHVPHALGIGKYPEVSLKKARDRAFAYRVKLADGVDVAAEHKKARRAPQVNTAPAASHGRTFEHCAYEFIRDKEAGWKGAGSSHQWAQSLRDYAFPYIGGMAIDRIETQHVVKLLRQPDEEANGKPFWDAKADTPRRVRNRIERILDWARARGYRDGDNPARWKGHLEHLLASGAKKVEHHAAVPVRQMPALMCKLRACDKASARALEFLALTAGRTEEVRSAKYGEFDLDQRVWVVPAERTKTGNRLGEDHVVPLSPRAVAIVKQQGVSRDPDAFVFAGSARARGAIGEKEMLKTMNRIDGAGATVHGLRSTFRNWCGENGHPFEAAEMALAHAVGRKTTRAYFRSKLVEERRKIMDAWAAYCGG